MYILWKYNKYNENYISCEKIYTFIFAYICICVFVCVYIHFYIFSTSKKKPLDYIALY